MPRRCIRLALLSLFILAAGLCAGDTDPQPDRQRIIDDMTRAFQQAGLRDLAQVRALPGKGGSIILRGYIKREEDAETILMVEHAVQGETKGRIVNALVVGPAPRIQMELVAIAVDRAALARRDEKLHRAYVDAFWRLRAVDEAEHQECLALLQKLQEPMVAKPLTDPYVEDDQLVRCMVMLHGQPGGCSFGPKTPLPALIPCGSMWYLPSAPGSYATSFVPSVLPKRKIRLEIETEFDTRDRHAVDRSEKAASVQPSRLARYALTLRDGQTAILGIPESYEEKQEPSDPKKAKVVEDVVFLATVHLVEAEKSAGDGKEAQRPKIEVPTVSPPMIDDGRKNKGVRNRSCKILTPFLLLIEK